MQACQPYTDAGPLLLTLSDSLPSMDIRHALPADIFEKLSNRVPVPGMPTINPSA